MLVGEAVAGEAVAFDAVMGVRVPMFARVEKSTQHINFLRKHLLFTNFLEPFLQLRRT